MFAAMEEWHQSPRTQVFGAYRVKQESAANGPHSQSIPSGSQFFVIKRSVSIEFSQNFFD
jgi:hypothetical protein